MENTLLFTLLFIHKIVHSLSQYNEIFWVNFDCILIRDFGIKVILSSLTEVVLIQVQIQDLVKWGPRF